MDSKLKNLYKQFSGQSSMALSANSKQQVKDRVFQKLTEQPGEETEPAVSLWDRIRQSVLMKSYILVPLVLLLFIASTAVASAQALPGDTLYQVKRQVEHARVFLASTAEAKLELELIFAEERLREFEKIQASGRVLVQEEQVKSNNTQANNPGNNNTKDNNDKKTGSDNNSSSNNREVRARQQAEGALDFLEKTREQYEDRQDSQRAQDISNKIENYRNRLYNQGNDESSGKAKENDFLRGSTENLRGSPELKVH